MKSQLIVPGPFFEVRTAIAQVGKFFGAPSELLVAMRLGDPDAARAYQAQTHAQTVEIVQGGSRITNMFIKEIQGMMPQLWMTPGGIDVIQTMRTMIAEFEVAEGAINEKYVEAVTTGPIPGDEESSPGLFSELRELKAEHAERWKELDIAGMIEDATAEAPNNWDEAAKALREGITAGIDADLPSLQQQIDNIGVTNEQAFLALGSIGQSLGMEVTLQGIDPVSGRALLKAKGEKDLLKTPRPFIEYISQPEPQQEVNIGEIQEIDETIVGDGEAPDEGDTPDPF